MTIDELLKQDTSGMSLSQMIDSVDGALDDENVIYAIRRRHESDSGVPMEDDDFGRGFSEMVEQTFPNIVKTLKEGDIEHA